MFSSGDNKLQEISTTDISTIIGEGTVINGDVSFKGGLHVDGKVMGNISAEADSKTTLTISKLGAVQGNVDVPIVIIDGAVEGDVSATERVQLVANARITGNVSYNLIEMSVGAEVNGQLVRHPGASAALGQSQLPEPEED
jgi:cytoskeletal protein CcmA (bactofilin family)